MVSGAMAASSAAGAAWQVALRVVNCTLRTETSHSLSMQLQWLDSLPADQLAHLAAMEATPTGTAAGNPAAGSSGSGANGGLPAEGPGASGAKGPVRRNNSSNGSNKA